MREEPKTVEEEAKSKHIDFITSLEDLDQIDSKQEPGKSEKLVDDNELLFAEIDAILKRQEAKERKRQQDFIKKENKKAALKEKQAKQKLTQKLIKNMMESVKQAKQSLPSMQLGSVPYGLPTVALTRRTIDTCIRSKQLELINNRMVQVLSKPS